MAKKRAGKGRKGSGERSRATDPVVEPTVVGGAPEAAACRQLRRFYLVLAFFGGFHVMLLEMCAFRVLYTNFGSSIFTSGVLLTLIMIALSVGYWLGGRMSERFGSVRYLLLALLGAVLYVHVFDVLLARQIVDWIFGIRGTMADSLSSVALRSAVPAGLATLLLYGVPMVILSQITPYLIKRTTAEGHGADAVGATAGRLMAVSTAGSIAGTLAATFALIPQLGVRATLSVFSVTVIALCLLGFWLARRMSRAAQLATALAVLSTAAFSCGTPGEPDLVLERETLYGSIKVYRHEDKKGRPYLVYKPNRISAHTRAYVNEPLRNHYIMQSINLGEVVGAKRYLVLGLAGGSALATLEAWAPGRDAVGVDIDPASLEVARDLFKVPRRIKLVAQDARMYLRDTKERFDLIFVDLFEGEQIPPHCISAEFFRLVRQRLAPGGVVTVNSLMLGMPPAGQLAGGRPLVAAWNLHQTLYEAGFLAVFHNDIFNNGNIYAFDGPMNEAALRAMIRRYIADPSRDANVRASLAGTYLKTFFVPKSKARAFTDAWAPELVFQLKANLKGYSEAVARERPSARGAIGGAYLAGLAAAPDEFWKAPARRARLCATAARAIAAGKVDVAQLARYQIDPLCAGLPVGRGRAARALKAYFSGLALLRRVEGEAALPRLLRAIELLPQ